MRYDLATMALAMALAAAVMAVGIWADKRDRRVWSWPDRIATRFYLDPHRPRRAGIILFRARRGGRRGERPSITGRR